MRVPRGQLSPFVGLPRRVRCGASFAEQGAVNGHGEGSGSSSTAEREGKERADRAGPAKLAPHRTLRGRPTKGPNPHLLRDNLEAKALAAARIKE